MPLLPACGEPRRGPLELAPLDEEGPRALAEPDHRALARIVGEVERVVAGPEPGGDSHDAVIAFAHARPPGPELAAGRASVASEPGRRRRW